MSTEDDFGVEFNPPDEEEIDAVVEIQNTDLFEREIFFAVEPQNFKTHTTLAWIGVIMTAISIASTSFWYVIGKSGSTSYLFEHGFMALINSGRLSLVPVDNSDFHFDPVFLFLYLILWNIFVLLAMVMVGVSDETLLALFDWFFAMHTCMIIIWVSCITQPVFQPESPVWTWFIVLLQIVITNVWTMANYWMSTIEVILDTFF